MVLRCLYFPGIFDCGTTGVTLDIRNISEPTWSVWVQKMKSKYFNNLHKNIVLCFRYLWKFQTTLVYACVMPLLKIHFLVCTTVHAFSLGLGNSRKSYKLFSLYAKSSQPRNQQAAEMRLTRAQYWIVESYFYLESLSLCVCVCQSNSYVLKKHLS